MHDEVYCVEYPMREINVCNHVFSDILALTQSSSQNKAHELRIETPGTCVGIYLWKKCKAYTKNLCCFKLYYRSIKNSNRSKLESSHSASC